MDQGLLVSREVDSGADMVRKLGMIWPVKAAFWLRGSDEDRSYLFIAIEGLDQVGTRSPYHDVNQIARKAPNPNFDHYRVKVIDADDPRARAAIDLNRRYPDPMSHRTGPKMFGDVFAEEIYVYPSTLPLAVV